MSSFKLLETKYMNHINELFKQKTNLLLTMQKQFVNELQQIHRMDKESAIRILRKQNETANTIIQSLPSQPPNIRNMPSLEPDNLDQTDKVIQSNTKKNKRKRRNPPSPRKRSPPRKKQKIHPLPKCAGKVDPACLRAIEQKNWKMVSVPSNGNSLYQCFAISIYGDASKQSLVRAQSCTYLRKNSSYFRNFMGDFDKQIRERKKITNRVAMWILWRFRSCIM